MNASANGGNGLGFFDDFTGDVIVRIDIVTALDEDIRTQQLDSFQGAAGVINGDVIDTFQCGQGFSSKCPSEKLMNHYKVV